MGDTAVDLNAKDCHLAAVAAGNSASSHISQTIASATKCFTKRNFIRHLDRSFAVLHPEAVRRDSAAVAGSRYS